MRLAAEAVVDALDDAGLTPSDVEGLTTFTMDSNTEIAATAGTGVPTSGLILGKLTAAMI